MIPFQYLNIDKKPVGFWHCSTGNGKYDQDRNQHPVAKPSYGNFEQLRAEPIRSGGFETFPVVSIWVHVRLRKFDSAWLDGYLRLLYNHTMYIYILYYIKKKIYIYIWYTYDIKWLYSQAQHKHPVNTEKRTSWKSQLRSVAA